MVVWDHRNLAQGNTCTASRYRIYVQELLEECGWDGREGSRTVRGGASWLRQTGGVVFGAQRRQPGGLVEVVEEESLGGLVVFPTVRPHIEFGLGWSPGGMGERG